MNRWRVILLIITDVLIIAELFVAMYFAHQYRDQFSFVFIGVFFGLMVPTLLLYFLIRSRAQHWK